MGARSRLLCASLGAALAAGAAGAEREAAPMREIVAEFRLEGGGGVAARGWRIGAAVYAAPETLAALGIAAPQGGDRIALSSVPGLSYRYDEAAQAVVISCASACFPARDIRGRIDEEAAFAPTRGMLIGADLAASVIDGYGEAAGAFHLGWFTARGQGDARFTLGAGGEDFVRLDTAWSIDLIDQRARLTLGDGVAAQGAGGAPIRFGGLRIGTDFSIDPRFVTFDTPVFQAEAAADSVVELYIDGALRLREEAAQGPFRIVEAPVVSGAGAARLVVTDVLGRARVIEAPFYAAPGTLRRGLSTFDLAIGAERRGFGRRSFDYGPAFIAGAYRRGFAGATAGVRGDLREGGAGIAGGVSLVGVGYGQIDADISASRQDGESGVYGQFAWTHIGRAAQANLTIGAASADFRALGARSAAPRLALRGAFGVQLFDGGSASVNAALIEAHDAESRGVYGASYSNTIGQDGALALNLIAIDDDDPSFYVGLSFTRAFGRDGVIAASAELDRGAATAGVRAAHTPPRGEGLAWRAGAAAGARARADLSIAARGRAFDARLDASQAGDSEGLRAQFATTLATVDGAWALTAPASEAFALVEVGAPGVTVRHEGRVVGRTDARGRLLFAGLRPYDINRVSVAIEDLPLRARLDIDEARVRPAGRGGVRLRFATAIGEAGEVRVLDRAGAPLMRGTMLVRDGDGARTPVGSEGRIYLSGVAGESVLRARGCVVRVGARDLGGTAQCGGDE